MKPTFAKKKALQEPMRELIPLLQAALTDLGATDCSSNLLGLIRAKRFDLAIVAAEQYSAQCTESSLKLFDDGSRNAAIRLYYKGAQLEHLIKKLPVEDGSLHPRVAALKKFWAAEHRCKRVNSRFQAHLRGDAGHGRLKGKQLPYVRILDEIRRDIFSLLGPRPDMENIYSRCRFGPGSAVGITGDTTHLLKKMDASTCTPAALPFATEAIWANFQMRTAYLPNKGGYVCYDQQAFRESVYSRMVLVTNNKIAFVPKTAKTDRTIAIEPAWNVFLQLGVDAYLKQKLQRWGIDLADQTRNNELARQGSCLSSINPLSTIDLSSASDSLAINLVRFLLPPEWFSFLNAIRSPSFILDGQQHRYEKFVSMGNGFCFPLESLIFGAAARAALRITGDHTMSVYGDDIIVPQSSSLVLIEILRYLGFRTNVSKTFVHGPFRESCGTDFFDGTNVRPFTLNYIPASLRDYIKIGNGLLDRYMLLPELYQLCINKVLPKGVITPYEPPCADGSLRVPLDVFMTSKWASWNRQLQCWRTRSYKDIPVLDKTRVPSTFMEEMLCITSGATSASGSPRFARRRKTRTVLVTI